MSESEDIETREASGGWEIPTKPDYESLERELIDGNFTFKRLSGGANVFLSGVENADLQKVAARNGFTIKSVEVIDGPHSARVRLERKRSARNTEDAEEHLHRLNDEDK